MLSKVSIKSFVYDLIKTFLFPNAEIREIYKKYKVNRCYLDQKLTDTDTTSMFFVFICDLNSNIREDKARNIIFEVTLKSKIFDRLDLSAEFYEQFSCWNENLRKRVGLFSKSVSKVQFGQLNDKRFYFSNGIVSLPYGHPYLENLRKQKDKYRNIHKVVQTKKDKFLKEESKIIEKIPRLNILKQIYSQTPILYELNSDTNFILSGWKTTKEYIKNGSCKWFLFTMGSFMEIY